MLWILIPVIIGFIVGYLNYSDIEDGVFGALTGLTIGLFLWFMFGGAIAYALPLNEVVEEQEIYALSDTTSIEGSKYIFSGYIDEELVCRYVINTDKGKHIEEVDADYVYINEGDYKPLVRKCTYEFEKKWHKLIAHRLLLDYHYEFYVPKNTITNQYIIDLE